MTPPGVYITELAPAGAGRPLAVKDLFDTAGVRTTYGSAIFADHVPAATAEAVLRLEAAGWANVGKANLHEFAWGITSENEHYGTVPNPVAPGRIAGGSSGGCAAAIALGIAAGGLGTDSGGSIRIPAACCGVTGFKPTHGLVPLEGCFPLAPSFDHVGPLAADVTGCVEMLAALAPELGGPASVASLGDLRVGVAWLGRADPLVRERVAAAAAHFPSRVELDLPDPDGFAPAFQREIAEVHAELFPAHRDAYGENVRVKLDGAFRLTDAEVEVARGVREAYRERMAALMDDVDLLVTPTLGMVAPPVGIGDLALRAGVIANTAPFNVIGAPALALPCGPAEEGFPASVQLVGKPGDDALVLAAGLLLEAALSRSGSSV